MKTPIADMIEQMLATGTVHEVIVAAVRAVEVAGEDQRHGRRSITAQSRGARLPDDWQPSEQCIAYALDHGMARDRLMIEAEKFRNYWTAKSGQNAVKRDWGATWRNWTLKALEMRSGSSTNYQNSRAHPVARSATIGADAILAGMGRVARRIVEKRNAAAPDDRKVARDTDSPRELDLRPSRA
jgi:hypothetical protein